MKKTKDRTIEEIKLPKDLIHKAGLATMIVGGVSLLTLITLCLVDKTPLQTSLVLIITFSLLMIPIVLVGNKLRVDDFKDLQITKRNTGGITDYTFAMVLIGSIFGLIPGLLLIIPTVLLLIVRRKIKTYMKVTFKNEMIKEEEEK